MSVMVARYVSYHSVYEDIEYSLNFGIFFFPNRWVWWTIILNISFCGAYLVIHPPSIYPNILSESIYERYGHNMVTVAHSVYAFNTAVMEEWKAKKEKNIYYKCIAISTNGYLFVRARKVHVQNIIKLTNKRVE